MATIEKSVEVKAPITPAYNQWTQFEDFPQFMQGIDEIRQLDDRRLHWRASFGGETHEDERVAWRNVEGKDNAGVVTFHKIDDGTTRVMLQMDWAPEGLKEKVGSALGVAERRIEGDLERFKAFIESRGGQETGAWRGEVPREG